ncbi:hypothetical protein ACTA71_001389 [Dictyostelium dimigraforme]
MKNLLGLFIFTLFISNFVVKSQVLCGPPNGDLDCYTDNPCIEGICNFMTGLCQFIIHCSTESSEQSCQESDCESIDPCVISYCNPDPSDSLKCIVEDKECPSIGSCEIGYCNETTGDCQLNWICPDPASENPCIPSDCYTDDLCFPGICNPDPNGEHCVITELVCPENDNCLQWHCNSTLGCQSIDFCTENPIPTPTPTPTPTQEPTDIPVIPTLTPTEEPTEEPTVEPSEEPSDEPSYESTEEQSKEISEEPTEEPTDFPETPSVTPTQSPTLEPTLTPNVTPNPNVKCYEYFDCPPGFNCLQISNFSYSCISKYFKDNCLTYRFK